MTSKDIVLKLSLTCPSDVLFAITMETVITAIVRRMGEEALAAGIFHWEEVPIEAVKEHMRERGIETR